MAKVKIKRNQSDCTSQKETVTVSDDTQSLIDRYHSPQDIIERMADMSIDIPTYLLLSDIFLSYMAQELGASSWSEKALRHYRGLQLDVMEFFEIARAARVLKDRYKK